MNELPSSSPNSRFSFSQALVDLITKIRQEISICMPCVVEEVNDTNLVVKPLISHPSTVVDGVSFKPRDSFVIRPFKLQFGGFSIDAPIKVGQTGWAISCDRDSTKVIEENAEFNLEDNKGIQDPVSLVNHSFIHGFFIPESWCKLTVSEEYANCLIIRNYDDEGNVSGSFAIHQDGRMEFVSSGIDIKSDVSIYGDLFVSQKITSSALSVTDGEISADILPEDLEGFGNAKFRDMDFVTDVNSDGTSFTIQRAKVLSTATQQKVFNVKTGISEERVRQIVDEEEAKISFPNVNFNPNFSNDGKLISVDDGYYNWGVTQRLTASGKTIETPSAEAQLVFLSVLLSNKTAYIDVGSMPPAYSSNIVSIPLYEVENGKISKVYTFYPILPFYDNL